jgi:23S rRNA G2445 N2-methylase RlmL
VAGGAERASLPGSSIRRSALGSDVSPAAIDRARANAERAGVRPGLSVADAAHPPWTLTADDVVVTNPPWGRAVAPSGGLRTSGDVADTVLRITAGRRAVVLIADPDLELADRSALAVPLSLFGSHPVLAVLDDAGAFPGNPALAEAHATFG